jgi:HEAT repeat protein
MVKVTALRADPERPGVLYATVDHVLGSTQVHASAAGAFVSLDGGASWQPLAGPSFPEAQHASSLVLLPASPLHVHAVTAGGLQAYAPDVAAALAALESPRPAERAAAVRLLGLARAEEAAGPLLAALTDADPAVSLAAGWALGQIADPATVGPLSVALEHPSTQVRLGAARALGMMGAETAVEPLRAMLLEGEGQEVTVAAEALGQIGTPAAVEALLVPLGDLSMTPRRHAALGALETLGQPAVGPLVERLDGDSSHIRRNAAEALGWVGDSSAVEPLAYALKRDRDAEVRTRSAWALGQIGDPAAHDALLRASRDDAAARVREQAAQALVQLGEGTRQQARAAGWPQNWAPALNRLQPLRWLFLISSLVGAAWLALGQGRLSPVPLLRRITNS